MVLVASGITKRFGPTLALDDVSLSLSLGKVHALVGENGSGKSTLMRVLHGEERPENGHMLLDDAVYFPRSPREAMSRRVALVHQELAVCPQMEIWENVFLGAEGGFSIAERIERTRELLTRLGRSDLDPRQEVGLLSPASQQIVEIARALRSDAKVILFDEPTSSLGRQDVSRLFDLIRELKQDRAIVYISHFLDEIAEVADEATVLRDGRLAGTADPKDTEHLIRLMTGREAEQVYHRSARTPGEPVLSIRGMTGRRAPVNASFELRRGEVLGIAGLNGAGRTEVVRCLFGLDHAKGSLATAGGERRLDRNNPYKTPGRWWRSGMGMVSEDRKTEGLALKLTLAENLTMPDPRGGTGTRTQAIIDRLRVKCTGPDQAISALSGGNQQKIAIGRLLDMDAEILLLDEPTRGIDIGSKAEIFRLINELADEGKSVILISSYLPELLGLCDRIAVMRRGEIVATLDATKTDEHEVMQLCTGA